jgi:hypothetical protein
MTTWPSATRAQIVARARQGFGNGLNTTPYSQDTITPSGYRADCSGFVSRCLGLTNAVGFGFWGGLNTVTLVSSGCLLPLPDPDALLQGDLCGELGPDTAGDNGHVYVFDRWLNTDPSDNRFYCWEQFGDNVGPSHTLRNWPYPDVCAPYRYAGLILPVPEPDLLEAEPMFLAHIQGQTAIYLVYADGTARHIQDTVTYQSLKARLGTEVAFSQRDFSALLKTA